MADRGGIGRRPLGARLDLDATAAGLALCRRRSHPRSRGAGLPRVSRAGDLRARIRPCAGDAPLSEPSLRDEVTGLLQRLIRVDTTNPPGNETAAAELLRDYLAESGVGCELIAKA